MKNDEGNKKDGMHRDDNHKRKGHHHHGAKTFRRGRALEFLERMYVKRATLKQQLDAPEFQSINQIIIGELKAIETVIDEFIKLFELHESEEMETENKKTKEESSHNEEEAME
ncbi:hypothetical protein NDK43_13535 [Neobacillus pocheonensis]|uniref:2-keto-3-deoxygluconate kinase n=1 Tax=Neobacillus pocheonensis TaxID=363869 RepID=A0ABT0WA75_9BACI|nr:hypothetical protein [Neobacillus pocheonensis]